MGSAHSAATALPLIRKTTPDVAVVDLGLPDTHGTELIEAIVTETETKVLVLSGRGEKLFAERVLRAGAQGFISKSGPTEDLVTAVLEIGRGGMWLSQAVAQMSVARMLGRRQHPTGLESLTPREMAVLELFGRGLALSDVAHRLGVSTKTVDTHRQRIRDKLGLENASQLTVFAARWVASDGSAT